MFKRSPASLLRQCLKIPEAKYSLWMFLGQVIVSAAALLLTFFLTNYVPEDVVGVYRFIIAVHVTVGIGTLSGLGTAVTRSAASGKTGALYPALRVRVLYSISVLVLCLAAAAYLYFFDQSSHQYVVPLILTAFLLPVMEAGGLYVNYLQGLSRFGEWSVLQALERVLVAALLIVSIVAAPQLIVLTAVYMFATAAVRVASLAYVVKKYPPLPVEDTEMIPYAKHLTLIQILTVISAQIDKYILIFFFSPAVLAGFWVASVIPMEVGRFVGIGIHTLFPRFVKQDIRLTITHVGALYVSLLVVALGATVVYGFAASWIFGIVFPNYLEYAVISTLLFFAYVCTPQSFIFTLITAQKHVQKIYLIHGVEPILTVVLYTVFVTQWGVIGLAYALCARTVVMNIIALFMLFDIKRKIRLSESVR